MRKVILYDLKLSAHQKKDRHQFDFKFDKATNKATVN